MDGIARRLSQVLGNALDTLRGAPPIGRAVPAGAVHWIDTTPVDSTDVPCAIEKLELDARVSGLYARVKQTLVISNPNRRALSVSLTIPLPDRAVVCGYALDIDGQMIDGVVVPKEEARIAFETERRRGADPGVVEAVKGNVYRTHVYPVPGHGRRTVRLTYVAPLLLGGAASAILDLPMPEETLPERHVRVDVEMLDCPIPQITSLGGAQFQPVRGYWSVESHEHDVTPGESVRVCLPELPTSFAVLERDDSGTVWFSASEKAPQSSGDAPAITSLTVLWDVSGSRAGIDHAQELELLRAYCASGRDRVKSIRLVEFGDHADEALAFESPERLCEHLAQVHYDGGTRLESLAEALRGLYGDGDGAAPGDACVLFTDGLDTLGEGAVVFPRACRVLAIVSGVERDVESLRQACGGLAFDVATAPRDLASLARAIYCPSALSGVRGDGVADLIGIGSGGDGRLTVIGRLTNPATCITFENTGTAFELAQADARPGSVLSRAWAARRVAQLSPRADDNADELLSLGRRFGVASPATSLIVLESLDQWLRYEIEPPASWKDMHERWERAREGVMRISPRQGDRNEHLRRLKSEWGRLLEWWERDLSAVGTGASGGARYDFCPSCGSHVNPGMRFCPCCGRPLGDSVVPLPVMGGAPRGDARAMEDLPFGSPYEAASIGGATRREEPLPRSSSAHGLGSLVSGLSRGLTRSASADASMRFAPSSAPASMPMDACEEMPSGTFGTFDAFAAADAASAPDAAGASDTASAAGAPASVTVKAWMPDAPYLGVLDEALPHSIERAREAYYRERPSYATSPSFFLDCAGWFMANGDREFGLRVLSNLAELRIEDAALLRVMAWRMREAGELELALSTLRHVLRLRGEDSQSHRDVALVLDELARADFARGDLELARTHATQAGETYRETALTPWRRRPMAIGLFAVEEYNVLRAWADAQEWGSAGAPDLPSLGEGLEGVLACDLRVTLAWDADETDVDIHVTEPSGEEAYYGHRMTSSGGRVSEDITDGYGPELYEIRSAGEGTYRIRAHYYASHQQSVFGPATCTLTVYTDWGRPSQSAQVTSTRLDREREMVLVGEAAYGEAALASDDSDQDEDGGDVHIAKGTPVAGLLRSFGSPAMGDPEDSDAELGWELSGGRLWVVKLLDGKIDRVVERMPWGEENVLLQ